MGDRKVSLSFGATGRGGGGGLWVKILFNSLGFFRDSAAYSPLL